MLRANGCRCRRESFRIQTVVRGSCPLASPGIGCVGGGLSSWRRHWSYR